MLVSCLATRPVPLRSDGGLPRYGVAAWLAAMVVGTTYTYVHESVALQLDRPRYGVAAWRVHMFMSQLLCSSTGPATEWRRGIHIGL